MQFDQSTRRRFLLGCAGATASVLSACTQQTLMPAVEFKGATTPNDVVTDSLLQQAQVLGAPTAAALRAVQISRQPIFPKKRLMKKTMDTKQKPSNLKAFRRIWTWCHWARLRQLIPRLWIPIRRLWTGTTEPFIQI